MWNSCCHFYYYFKNCKSTETATGIIKSFFSHNIYSLKSTYKSKSHKLMKYNKIYLAGTGSLGQRPFALNDAYSEGFRL